jgi:hypothetical protein
MVVFILLMVLATTILLTRKYNPELGSKMQVFFVISFICIILIQLLLSFF